MSRPAPWVSAVVAQTVVEARLTARRGENLLAMIGIPLAVLLFVGFLMPGSWRIAASLPGTFTTALVASGLVNLGIATAYERGYGVLKRLGGSPLGPSGLVAAKLAVVVVVGLAQVVALATLAVVLGWPLDPRLSVPELVLTTILGSIAFAGIGLAIAGTLRPDAALVVANVLFLVALGLGGALVPIGDLPAPLAALVRVLPIGALSEAFASALGSGGHLAGPLAIVGAWAVGSVVLAARTFRWD